MSVLLILRDRTMPPSVSVDLVFKDVAFIVVGERAILKIVFSASSLLIYCVKDEPSTIH